MVGATALIQQVRRGRGHPSPWLVELIKRKPPKLAAVALANKTARIAWKLMVSGERYKPHHAAEPPQPVVSPGCQFSAVLAPSRPLRAACGGALRAALTALARGASRRPSVRRTEWSHDQTKECPIMSLNSCSDQLTIRRVAKLASRRGRSLLETEQMV